MLTELVRDPRPYFEQRVKYPTLRLQTILVVLATVTAIAWRPALFVPLGRAFPFVEDAIIMLTLLDLVLVGLLWLIATAVMHFLGAVLAGESSYGQLLRLTGYGFAPLAVGGAVRSASFYLALRNAVPPEAPRSSGFEPSYAVWVDYLAQIGSDPVFLGGLAVSSVFVLAAGYLWLQAVQVVAGLETDRAGLVAAAGTLPVLVWWLRPLIL